MGLLERIRNAVRTNLAEIADRLEEPEARLDQLIARMESDLDDARLELGAALRDVDALRGEGEAARAAAADFEGKARLAVGAGDEDLAREALRRVESHLGRVDCLLHEASLQTATTAMLRHHVLALERKLEQARRQRETVAARRRLAEAQQALARRASWADAEVSAALQQRIDELDAATLASGELLGEGAALGLPSEDRVEARLDRLRREIDAARRGGEEE